VIPVRALVGFCAFAVVAGFVAGTVRQARSRPAAPPAAALPPAAAEAPAADPLLSPPAERGGRPRVPAGILARAASARALERGPSCRPSAPATPQEPARCVPEQRESIDIDWHVARDP
jgi:hypothetical protein